LRSGYGRVLVFVCFHYSNLFISGIDYYKHREIFGSLKVYFIYGLCTGFIFIGFNLFIGLWDIGHAECLQLLACNEPPGDDAVAKSIMSLHTRLLRPSTNFTVYTPLLPYHRQCQRSPHSRALNFHAERSSPLTAGDFNISNYTILNTFKMHGRKI
jgi:hypothetical protein